VQPSGEISIQIDAGATAYRVGGSRFTESLLALVNVFATSPASLGGATPSSAVVRTLEPGLSSDARGLLILWNRSLPESSKASPTDELKLANCKSLLQEGVNASLADLQDKEFRVRLRTLTDRLLACL